MKLLKLTVLAVFVSSVAACGGGGGSGGGNAPAPAPKPLNPTTSATKTETQATAQNQTNASATPKTETTPTVSTPKVENPATSQNQPTTPAAENQTPNVLPNTQPQTKPEPEPQAIATKDNIDFLHQNPKGELAQDIVDQNGNKVGELVGYNRAYSFNGAMKKEENKELSQIVVDKMVLSLANKLSFAGLIGRAASNFLKAGWNALSNDPERDIFYDGVETPVSNIPTEGVFTYKGNASRYDNVDGIVKNIGTSEFTADFGNKKISGELAIDGLWRRNISLKEADINGNSFNGKAVAGENHILITREGTYEGKFYGPNADEVAGKATFAEAQKDLNTSFSAEKQ